MKKGFLYVVFVLIFAIVFTKIAIFAGNKMANDGFNGYWSPRNSEMEYDFYFKGNKMTEIDSQGNETSYKLINKSGSYEIDPSSIPDSSIFSGAYTVDIWNDGDVQYINVDYDTGSVYEIKLYKADKSDTYFSSKNGLLSTTNFTWIAIILGSLGIGYNQYAAKKKTAAES